MAAHDVFTNLNLWKLSRLLVDYERCTEWCKEHNLFSSSMKYPKPECENALKWQRRTASGDGFLWRCSRKNCNGQASIRQKSWFSGSMLSLEKILALTYAWAHKFTTTQAVLGTALDEETTSTKTGIDCYNYCREVCADRIMKQHAGPIGGPGTTVEIDESKFGKMKYHKGRYIEGQWVFGGISRETKACFLVPVERREKETLLPIIRAQILPGTRVVSVEITWWGVKLSLLRTGTSMVLFESYLQEWLWRQQNKHDPFGNIIEHIADL
ncbi:uncharacterized protein [Montipora foliosa]|uniref:uncharacterized protein n=1 Tax=Montipora foliosa TaxID=591990 RepID=UPI0035F19815